MLTKALILTLLALTGVYSDCTCYTNPTSNLTGLKISISNAYDSNDFSTCYKECGFLAYSGSATVGWSNITVTFSNAADPTGKFIIYDGKDSSANTAQAATYSFANNGKTVSFTSSTPYIYVKYTQTTTTVPGAYFGTIMAGSTFAAPLTTQAPTAAPTTRTFTSSLYPKDPWLISHDTLILVNQRTDQGAAGLNALNNLTTQFVNQLAVVTSISAPSKSRLGLATVTPYSPFYSAQGEIWGMSAADVVNALPKSGVSIDVNIVQALTAAVPTFFNVADLVAPTRQSVQRSVILFTAWWQDSQTLDSLQKVFADNGVNLAVVGFNTNSDSLTSNDWYNYVSLSTTTEQDVANIINRYYMNNAGFNGNVLTNNWCKKSADPVPGTDANTIMEPNNYLGPKDSGAWDVSYTGQMGRYCNFQDTTYTYTRANPSKMVAVTVNYELEVEQDYLKFFADGVEVESFTGFDVQGASFQLNATTITARFTTDNSGVQRGFYVKFLEN